MGRKELDDLRKKVNEALGLKEETLIPMAASDSDMVVRDGLSSGSLMLNLAMSGNPFVGYAWGRIAEIYGPESSGKTTMALHAVHEAQKREEITGDLMPCLYIDAEHSIDRPYAESLGIDMERLTIAQPDCAEVSLSAAEHAIKVGFKVVVVDSVAALVPRAEAEGEMGEAHVGLQARLLSQACRKLSPIVAKNDALLIFINQIRMKIGVMFGNPETRSGGQALRYYSTYILDVRAPRSGKLSGKTLMGYGESADAVSTETGTKVNVTTRKNKVFPPHRSAKMVIEYGKGIDRVKDIIDFLEYSRAFSVAKRSKSKSPVLRIHSKNKSFSSKELATLLSEEPDLISEVYDIIEAREEIRRNRMLEKNGGSEV